MRVSRSVSYGLLAVGYIAQHQRKGLILSQTISKEYDIPLEYLLKIMRELARATILRSKRGPRGGYSLARPLEKITMLEIIEAISGPLDTSLGLTEHAKGKFSSNTQKVYGKVISQARDAFQKVKLSDLV